MNSYSRIDYDKELRKKLEAHYCSHRSFMNNDEFTRFITTNLTTETQQQPWINTLNLLFPDLHTKKILEIGCGTGGFVVALSLLGYHIKGCDLSPDNIEMAKLRCKKYGLTETIVSVSGETTLPYSDESFDIIVMFDVLEHVSDILSILEESSRVLKNKGHFFSSCPNKLWPKEPHINLFFPQWLPSSVRYYYVKKMRGQQALEIINDINYLTSAKIKKLILDHFSKCFLNDEIFLMKNRSDYKLKTNQLNQLIKKLICFPPIWFFFKPVFRFLWPQIYILAQK